MFVNVCNCFLSSLPSVVLPAPSGRFAFFADRIFNHDYALAPGARLRKHQPSCVFTLVGLDGDCGSPDRASSSRHRWKRAAVARARAGSPWQSAPSFVLLVVADFLTFDDWMARLGVTHRYHRRVATNTLLDPASLVRWSPSPTLLAALLRGRAASKKAAGTYARRAVENLTAAALRTGVLDVGSLNLLDYPEYGQLWSVGGGARKAIATVVVHHVGRCWVPMRRGHDIYSSDGIARDRFIDEVNEHRASGAASCPTEIQSVFDNHRPCWALLRKLAPAATTLVLEGFPLTLCLWVDANLTEWFPVLERVEYRACEIDNLNVSLPDSYDLYGTPYVGRPVRDRVFDRCRFFDSINVHSFYLGGALRRPSGLADLTRFRAALTESACRANCRVTFLSG